LEHIFVKHKGKSRKGMRRSHWPRKGWGSMTMRWDAAGESEVANQRERTDPKPALSQSRGMDRDRLKMGKKKKERGEKCV
jgi:hypothetical protein